MMDTHGPDVAVIGGSIAGLTLALSLHQQKISCTVYESRDASYEHGGAIMLAPNALRILDELGALSRLHTRGFSFKSVAFMTEDHVKEGEWCFGDKDLYGYDGLRVYRSEILKELRNLMQERHIPMHYNARYKRIVSESAGTGVDFELDDGSTHCAFMLVGADGIHSRVRKYITEEEPKYMGAMAITFACDTAHLRLPSAEYKLPVSIAGEKGAFIIAPQTPDGSECLVGTQWKHPEETLEGWRRILQDQDGLVKRLHADYSSWGDLPRSALENIKRETLNMWPFYHLSNLDKWTSKVGRVILMGDAAHSIPPTLGQGANQAFEDGYALALLVGDAAPFAEQPATTLDDSIVFWRQYRAQRIGKVMELTFKMNNRRLPTTERAALPKDQIWDEAKDGKLDWLYDPKIEQDMKRWLDEHGIA